MIAIYMVVIWIIMFVCWFGELDFYSKLALVVCQILILVKQIHEMKVR